jgi:intracellular sulfur oxidation DsrE/DsrF family protein
MSNEKIDENRRDLMGKLLVGSSAIALSGQAIAASEKDSADAELRFPGEEAKHNVVYQFNKADEEYHQHVLFSVGAMLRKYGDDIHIVVTCIGPGLHILAKNPGRPVSEETKQRVSSLSQYGVEFHACGNTMKSLKWTKKDLYDFAEVVEVGAADLVELQEKGYSYISW